MNKAASSPLRLTDSLQSLFHVQTGEAGVVALMVLYSAAAAGGVWTIGFSGVGAALFLSRLPASDVPFTFILPAGTIVLMLAGYSRLAARLSLSRLSAATSALLLLLAVTFRVLLALGYGRSFGVLAGIYLYCEAAGSLVLVQFWTFAGQIFNPRQARRLFGLTAAGGTLSSAAAGLVLAELTRSIGVDNLILIVAGSCGVCGACALLLHKHVPSRTSSRERASDPDPRTAQPPLLDELREVWRTPLLRSIALITVLLSLLVNIGAYQFFLVLQTTYSGRSVALAGFLGAFAIWTGLAALAIQTFGTGPVMMRFGPLVAQAIFPLAMAVAAGATLLAWGALWAVTLTRAFDPSLRRTVHDASVNALYLPLPAEQRQRAKTVLEGLYAVTFGVAGTAFLLVQRLVPAWTYQYWSVPVLLLGACWVGVLITTRRQYVAALARGIDTRRLSFDDLVLNLADETTTQVLVGALANPDARVVIHVLDLIATAPGTAWLPHVVPLLGHPSPQVKVMALRCLKLAGDADYADSITGLLAAPEDEVSSAAVTTLAALLGSNAVELVAPLLGESRPETAAAAVAALVRHGDAIHRHAATTRLRAMLDAGAPAMRRPAAHALGALAGTTLDLDTLGPLTGFVASGVPATNASDVLIACLIRLLEDRQTRVGAADSLALHGAAAIPALAQVLADRRVAPVLRRHAATILQRIGGSAAAAALLDRRGEPDLAVRGAAAHALADLRLRESAVSIDGSLLEGWIMSEISECYRMRLWTEDLQLESEDNLLGEALGERVRRGLDRVFFLLQARYPKHDFARAHMAATSAAREGKAMALEMLDSVVDRHLAGLLLPLIEASGARIAVIATRQLDMPRRSPAECMAELTEGGDPWLRACALHRIGQAQDPRLTPLALEALSTPDDLVRETALAACRRLLAPQHFAELLTEQTGAGAFPVTLRYAQALLREAAG